MLLRLSFVENGWAGILIKGRVCYVNADYLTQKQVITSTTNKMTSTAINETLNNNTNTDSTVYVIKRGDTFTKIGKAFEVSVPTLQELNRTIDPSKLKIGQTIKIATYLVDILKTTIQTQVTFCICALRVVILLPKSVKH